MRIYISADYLILLILIQVDSRGLCLFVCLEFYRSVDRLQLQFQMRHEWELSLVEIE